MIKTLPVPPAIQSPRPWTPGVPGFTPHWDLGVILHLSKLCEGDILEIGCNQGSTTFQLATENPNKHVFGIDWTGVPTVCPEQVNEQDIAKVELGKAAKHLPNVTIRDINSREYDYKALSPKVGFVFIDGDHSYDGVKADTENALRHLAFGRVLDKDRRAIVWHDYCPLEWRHKSPAWLQVGDYLRKELVNMDLIHFQGSDVAALLFGSWPLDLFTGI